MIGVWLKDITAALAPAQKQMMPYCMGYLISRNAHELQMYRYLYEGILETQHSIDQIN